MPWRWRALFDRGYFISLARVGGCVKVFVWVFGGFVGVGRGLMGWMGLMGPVVAVECREGVRGIGRSNRRRVTTAGLPTTRRTQTADSKTIPGIEFQVITDTRNNHFQLVETGWYEKQFIHSVIFHFQIKPDGKIWLLANNTDIPITDELIKRGVPISDIVLGFHPEKYRAYSGFAVH